MGKIINMNPKVKTQDSEEVAETCECTNECTCEPQCREETSIQENAIPQLNEDQRKILIAEYNRNNEGFCEIEDIPSEEVTEDFQNECKKDFEDVVTEANTMQFLIADEEKAMETAVFLADWNANKNHWHRAYWKGVIEFNKFIEEKIDLLEKEEIKTLELDYPALIFCYQSMMSPQGVGLLEAQEMAAIDEQYNAILNVIGDYVDKIQLYDKKAKLYQERWALACNGFKMNILIKDLEDFANVDMSQRQ